mmetsp:Transcript_41942/g.118629  ORF Transcript_41942/g.118629 Transcript_41942/m.118629 type:complete len:250 (-) Transcript_41942:414-1163(-)
MRHFKKLYKTSTAAWVVSDNRLAKKTSVRLCSKTPTKCSSNEANSPFTASCDNANCQSRNVFCMRARHCAPTKRAVTAIADSKRCVFAVRSMSMAKRKQTRHTNNEPWRACMANVCCCLCITTSMCIAELAFTTLCHHAPNTVRKVSHSTSSTTKSKRNSAKRRQRSICFSNSASMVARFHAAKYTRAPDWSANDTSDVRVSGRLTTDKGVSGRLTICNMVCAEVSDIAWKGCRADPGVIGWLPVCTSI